MPGTINKPNITGTQWWLLLTFVQKCWLPGSFSNPLKVSDSESLWQVFPMWWCTFIVKLVNESQRKLWQEVVVSPPWLWIVAGVCGSLDQISRGFANWQCYPESVSFIRPEIRQEMGHPLWVGGGGYTPAWLFADMFALAGREIKRLMQSEYLCMVFYVVIIAL